MIVGRLHRSGDSGYSRKNWQTGARESEVPMRGDGAVRMWKSGGRAPGYLVAEVGMPCSQG